MRISAADHAAFFVRAGHSAAQPFGGVRSWWQNLSLAARFLIASAIVIGIGMAALEKWTGERIRSGVIQNAVLDAAPYLAGYVRPYLVELATQPDLSPQSRTKLDGLLVDSPLGEKVRRITIWDRGGKALYSTGRDVSGKALSVSSQLSRAWTGTVAARFIEADNASRGAYLDIYVPIRARASEQIIAVAEFHETARDLADDLRLARWQTRAIVASFALAMIAALYGIVHSGSHLIHSQQEALSERVAQLTRFIEHNQQLRRRVAAATRRGVETSDLFLRRLGSELHDGPAQLIAFGLLKLDAIKPRDGAEEALADHEAVRDALRDALAEIRGISEGLSLPELKGHSVAEAIEIAVCHHERRTHTRVGVDLTGAMQRPAPLVLLTCVYRFVQECLNNAYRHAAGNGQAVRLREDAHSMEICVADKGPGLKDCAKAIDGNRLGLLGLRDRVESLGGVFEICSQTGTGTQVTARLDVK